MNLLPKQMLKMKHRCETCGCPVNILGNTTKYYSQNYDQLEARLQSCENRLKIAVETLEFYGGEKAWHVANCSSEVEPGKAATDALASIQAHEADAEKDSPYMNMIKAKEE